MVEKFNEKRVIFPSGGQGKFIRKAEKKISIEKMAKLCGFSERTIRDWRREKFLMDLNALQKICKKINISVPLRIKLKDKYWYGLKGASLGGKATWKKYGRIGNDAYRKKKWREWWVKEGRFKQNNIFNVPKTIKWPKFSKELAEFTGIMLGDGGISKYQVAITLCSKDEGIYADFVRRLIEKLFQVPVNTLLRKENSTINLIISRVNLVKFCTEKLGLKQGNKVIQQVDIPRWIKNNKIYLIACVRGLIDTDGSVFEHRYKVNGKLYLYKKINFTSRSSPLKLSLFFFLKKMGIRARLAGLYDVRIDSQEDMKKYFNIFGSHNSKHLIKYKK